LKGAALAKNHDVKDISLAGKGKLRIEWAEQNMPVLRKIRARYEKEKPFKGLHLGTCLHVTTETANLMWTLQAGGADVSLCASNPLSTQDDVAASLVKDFGVATFAIKGEDNKTYYNHINAILDFKPQITMDDGADLLSELHKNRPKQIPGMMGSNEETTTGVIRLRAMERDGALKLPVIAVNDSYTKHLFDNRYGTGQSTVDGIIRATNVLLAGKNFVIAGYGWCGRGLASRARGMGAQVIITEINPVRALEAIMDGYQVMPMTKAAEIGDIFVTATGDKHVIDKTHFELMKSGAMIANTGHFDVEINLVALGKLAKSRRVIREYVEEYKLKDGRALYILGEGRLINLAAAEGHPAQVMDMSFANQALAAEYLVKNHKKLQPKVYRLPEELDTEIAAIKLAAMGTDIDVLTAEQEKYLTSWEEGT
jgi:adenosylhomocysteinase